MQMLRTHKPHTMQRISFFYLATKSNQKLWECGNTLLENALLSPIAQKNTKQTPADAKVDRDHETIMSPIYVGFWFSTARDILDFWVIHRKMIGGVYLKIPWLEIPRKKKSAHHQSSII